MKKIAVVGSGYVGLVAAACFSEIGHEVICIDKQQEKIEKLKNGIIPIYEPGLKEIVLRNTAEKRLIFSTELISSCQKSDAIFIAVGTPPCVENEKEANLDDFYQVVEDIAKQVDGYKVIVNKSTVPVGTGEKTLEIIRKSGKTFDVVSNPEFLREGVAIEDFMKPDRVVIGIENKKSKQEMLAIYQPLITLNQDRDIMFTMDIKSAEMTKYVANAMLACRISFMNEISELCRKVDANVDDIKRGIGSDHRIGRYFLSSGIGYGGSCFPKDVEAIVKTAEINDTDFSILKAVQNRNNQQKKIIVEQIKKDFGADLKGKKFTLWGLAFKPETDDIREAPSLTIIQQLLKLGAEIHCHDEQAVDNVKKYFQQNPNYNQLFFYDDKYDATQESDGLILCTEWHQYYEVDFEKISQNMRDKYIYDGRRIWSKKWSEEQKDNSFHWWKV